MKYILYFLKIIFHINTRNNILERTKEMTREQAKNLLNELLELEEKHDIGNLTRTERREFQSIVQEFMENDRELLLIEDR